MLRRTFLLALFAVLVSAAPAMAQAAVGAGTAPPTLGALYRDGQTARYLLGGPWLFAGDPGDVGLTRGWQRASSTAGWTPVSVPNSWNAGDFSTASMTGQVAWYRRDFTVPGHAFASYVPRANRRWIVRFESVNYRATVWLNGHLVGGHVGAYLPFEFDLGTLRPGVNRLVIRVDDRRGPTDLPLGPGGGWFNFGGLQREVYLRAVQSVDISQVQVRTPVRCQTCAATIDEQAVLHNVTAAPQTVSLTGRYGALPLHFATVHLPAGASQTVTASATLRHPHLWAIGDPYLYRDTLTLNDAQGRRLGGYVTYSGVRTITVTKDGRLALNGRLLNLRGVNLHEQAVNDGAALTTAQLRKLIDMARGVGADLIRAHYPLGPQFEEMADEDGVLLWSEIPVYQTASQYLSQSAWLSQAHATLENNILSNENHPSVMVWSIANELETPPPPSEAAYIAGAAALAHKLDPTRPVGMAISDWPGVPCQAAYAPLDVIGFNDYFGWYDAGGGSTDDRVELSPFLDSLRACYPHQALLVTEFGFEANRNGPVEERGTYQFQTNSVAFHLGVFATKHWLSGAIYFPLQDFAVNPKWVGGNPWPDPPWLHKGLFDQYWNPKPAEAVVSAAFHATKQIAAPAR